MWLPALFAAAALSVSAPPATYTGPVVSFSYPAAWQLQAWQEPTHNFVPLVGVSTQALHDPCALSGDTIRCGFPVDRLNPGGVLGWWAKIGLTITPPGAIVTNTTIGGRRAYYRLYKRPGHCAQIGGDRTIVVTVAPGDLHFEACLRRPGLLAHTRQIRAMLASTTFSSP